MAVRLDRHREAISDNYIRSRRCNDANRQRRKGADGVVQLSHGRANQLKALHATSEGGQYLGGF